MGFDISKSIHTLKYGLYIFAASIPAIILSGIVSVSLMSIVMDAFLATEDASTGLVMLLVAVLAMVFTYSLCFIQVIAFSVNEAVSDANLAGYENSGYGGSWKTAFNITIELGVLLIGIIVLMVLGSNLEMGSLTMIGLLMLTLMYMGLIPYIIRRTVEGNAGSGNTGGSKLEPLSQNDALDGLYPPGSDGN